jgi:putative transposase
MPETAFFTADPEENLKELLQPWQLLLLVLAGWVNRQQQDVIEYLLAENRVMRQKLGKRRILLNDEQRRMLAIKGKVLGRKVLEQVAGIVTPETILRWNRELIARHWDYSDRRKKTGRPAVPREVADLIVKLAKENSRWGYNRIQGAVRNLGYSISDTAIAKILKAHGIDPAPDRKRPGNWKEFLSTHWDVLASVDFKTIGVWTKKGLVNYYLLFFMELATRRVHLAGMTMHPDEEWLLQVARNVTDAEVGFLRGKRYLLMDRDGKFSEMFRETLQASGVKPVRLPPRSPNLNANIERFNAQPERRMPGSDDFLRREVAPDRHVELCGSLSSGAQPSRDGQPAADSGERSWRESWCGDLPGTSRRIAAVLPPPGCMSARQRYWQPLRNRPVVIVYVSNAKRLRPSCSCPAGSIQKRPKLSPDSAENSR